MYSSSSNAPYLTSTLAVTCESYCLLYYRIDTGEITTKQAGVRSLLVYWLDFVLSSYSSIHVDAVFLDMPSKTFSQSCFLALQWNKPDPLSHSSYKLLNSQLASVVATNGSCHGRLVLELMNLAMNIS
uniref:Uncharacterized protein n=1 Tax=Triticum urartu TaxID=4572 RepID=A0A8R7V2C7_TRIUA